MPFVSTNRPPKSKTELHLEQIINTYTSFPAPSAKRKMCEIDAIVRDTTAREKAKTTLNSYATAVSKFFVLITTLHIPVLDILDIAPSTTRDHTIFKQGLLTAYMADVQKSQKKASTCRDYAGQVNIWWHRVTSTTLWTPEMMENAGGFVHSLKKVKRFFSAERLGLYSIDVIVMIRTGHLWVATGRPINLHGARCRKDLWSTQIIDLISAQYAFVSGNSMRFGESDDPGNSDFDFTIRITRSMVKITTRMDGVRVMTIKDPARKSLNSKSGKPMTMTFNSDPLNWPTLVEKLMISHPVHPIHAAQTPLFRDPRGLKLTDGFFPPSTKVMSADWSLRIMRQLIEANPVHFKDRLDADGKASAFGLHSHKIGHYNELLDAGATEPVARASARWDGDSFKLYHRLSQAEDHKWSRKASAGTVPPKMP